MCRSSLVRYKEDRFYFGIRRKKLYVPKSFRRSFQRIEKRLLKEKRISSKYRI